MTPESVARDTKPSNSLGIRGTYPEHVRVEECLEQFSRFPPGTSLAYSNRSITLWIDHIAIDMLQDDIMPIRSTALATSINS